MNANLTAMLKEAALEWGADLVGISPISRFANAPIMMSPQGILPTAKNVVVCAIHHPDEAMELGGEKHPQEIGPYAIQYVMNSKLDYMAYRIANLLDGLGYEAVPIASSNIWRYRPFMDLQADFAPDMSHIYAAVCAGLGQLGWHGLTMTPEYGAWNRFVSIITDAPLCPTELYEDTRLCDMCGECIRHCPTDAYRKEVDGVNVLEVEGRQHKFANKNLWRCAWGEHFDLDLDLEIPDVVDEKTLLEHVDKYGLRGGEMGCCLKYCLPRELRQDGEGHTSTYIRKKHCVATDLPVHRRLYDEIANYVRRYSVDNVVFLDEAAVDGLGGKKAYDKARGAVVMSLSYHKNPTDGIDFASRAAGPLLGFARLDVTRMLDNAGFTALNNPPVDREAYAAIAGIGPSGTAGRQNGVGQPDGRETQIEVVLTSAPLKRYAYWDISAPSDNRRLSLTDNLCRLMEAEGSDLYAVVPAARMEALTGRLEPIKGGEPLLRAAHNAPRFSPYRPEVFEYRRKLRRPSDYLAGAKNVIIMGLHYPEIVQKMTIKPPAFAVGPYLFSKYENANELAYSALKVCKYLQAKGYEAAASYDLTGTGGEMATPRGLLPDAFSNCLEAVEAGIGQLAANGVCYTAEHGFSQGFVAIVTNAPLDTVCRAKEMQRDVIAACAGCDQCIKACPSRALKAEKMVEIELCGRQYKWIPTDGKACDWSRKFALCGEEGHKYTGSQTEVAAPEQITPEALEGAFAKTDRILQYRPTTVHRCIIDCPLV